MDNQLQIELNRATLERIEIADELTIDHHRRAKPRERRGAEELWRLLEQRHSKDVFVPECKNGPTQSASNYLRMDAWVMNRSWANPCAWVYEIKVSRSDFIADNKWPAYLPYCNQFYFVTPAKLIDPREVPSQVGLLEAQGKGNGARLITKKKAPYREIEMPESLYRYILMCRVGVQPEYQGKESNAAFWEEWLTRKAENQGLGCSVSRRIRERATELEIESARLTQLMAGYDRVRETIRALGFNPDSGWYHGLERKIETLKQVVDESLKVALLRTKSGVDAALDRIAEIEAEAKESHVDVTTEREDATL